MINEYQLRQILLLKQTTFDYKNNKTNLNNLISRVEELLEVLEGLDSIWNEQMKILWFKLEIINALSLSNQVDNFTLADVKEINNTISSMEELINKKLYEI